MSSKIPPIPSFTGINYNPAFFTSPTSYITLTYANANYLRRVGSPTSVASNTTFTGLLTVSQDSYFNSVRIGRGGATGNTNVSLGGTIGTTSNNCTSVGNTATTTNSYATAIGADSQALNNYSTALGYAASSTGVGSTAIGYNSTASANQISLGTSSETVLCKGTASNTSLIATSNITVAGLTVGTSNASLYPGAVGNTLFGVSAGTAINNAAADHNTLIGNTAGSAITSGARNTAVGFESLNANQASNDNTAVGYNALKLYKGQTGFTSSTAFGSNALSKIESGGYACAFGTNALLNATGTSNNAFGANAGVSITTGIANIFIGGDYPVGGSPANGNKIATGDNNVFIGQEPICASTTNSNSIILGTKCTITGNNAVAIGYQVSAGANEIVLGGTSQTVFCKGTGTSITASGAISAAGAVTTTSVGGMSARVYNIDEYNATANTPYVGALLQQGAIGSLRIYNNKAGGTTPVATELYISTMTAAKVSVDSMVITSTDIQMKLPITLQTTYASAPSSAQLGYSVTIGGGSTNVPTGTATSICGITPIPVGVWIINYTSTLTSAAAASFNGFQMGISTTTGFGGLINPSGFQISAATESFSGADTSVKSGSFTYTNATGSSATLYVIVQLAILTGTFTGVATAYLTRIG